MYAKRAFKDISLRTEPVHFRRYDNALKSYACRAVFVVGATQDKNVQEALDQEYDKNRDIMQYNFIDSYA